MPNKYLKGASITAKKERIVMLLAIDCGNTHLSIGLYQEEELLGHWRIASISQRTEDEYLAIFSSLLGQKGYSWSGIKDIIFASVVPAVSRNLRLLAVKYLGKEALEITWQTPAGIPIMLEKPEELGPDRLVNAMAALHDFGGPLIIVDLGTATTFDCISAQGEYLGGAIAPGLAISREALFSKAARLAQIELSAPVQVIGRNTAQCLRSGIFWGFGGQIDGLVRRMAAEMEGRPRVIATGGLAGQIAEYCETIELVEPFLTLRGLALIYRRVECGV